MSLKNRIEQFVRNRGDRWTSGTELEDRAREVGKKASNASRRCRELVDEGIFERRLNSRRCVEYRYKHKIYEMTAIKKIGEDFQTFIQSLPF